MKDNLQISFRIVRTKFEGIVSCKIKGLTGWELATQIKRDSAIDALKDAQELKMLLLVHVPVVN